MTPLTIVFLVASLGLLIAGSALLSGLETALFSLKNHQIQSLQDRHPALAPFINTFRENPRKILNVILLGDTLVNVALVVLGLFFLNRPSIAHHVSQWLAAGALFAIIVLVCDLVPKLVALRGPSASSVFGMFLLKGVMPLLDPFGRALESASEAVVNSIAPKDFLKRARLTDAELETLVEMGEEAGTLHEVEGEMIQEIIKLGDKTAKDCMTPRVDTFALPDDLTNEEAIARLKRQRHRRVPVYAETPDYIMGIVEVKRFLLNPTSHYTEQLIPPSYVPETMNAMDLLRNFLSHPQGLAIVVDEWGGTEGIVTLNDIVEEIISDAVPRGDAALYIEPLDNCRFLVSGNARLDDVSEHLGFELAAEGLDTIGGLVFNRLGHLPKPGTRLEIPRLAITVQRTSKKRIEELLLEKTGNVHAAEAEETDRDNPA